MFGFIHHRHSQQVVFRYDLCHLFLAIGELHADDTMMHKLFDTLLRGCQHQILQ